MPLVEILSIEVGTAIAKSILKLWLKDSGIAFDVSSSVIDALKSVTSDRIVQRRAERQLEEIGEQIGKNLLAVFRLDGSQLKESSCNAVALAVAETLNTLTSATIVQHELEPSKLAKYLLQTYPPSKYFFNQTEAFLYERTIAESCVYIVDIASQLPAFSERAFAELFRRENSLFDMVKKILNEVQYLRDRVNPQEAASRFELEYRRSVARRLDVLELFGVDVQNTIRRYRLSVAYITLSVAIDSPFNVNQYRNKKDAVLWDSEFPEAIRGREFPSEAENISISKSKFNTETISVEKILVNSSALPHQVRKLLLITGMAGSGKTTLLQWIAVNSASESFKGDLANWNAKLPFYIRLRQHVQSNLPAPEEFPKLIAPAIADTMPKAWVHEKLKSGHAIVLIDGLDEIPTLQRNRVYIWLNDLVKSFSQTSFILTSRPHAANVEWLQEFDKAELQPMEFSNIRAFIDHWHTAVAGELQDEQDKTELPILAEHLKETLKFDRSKRKLATNPLLCAMFCALNRERKKQLPSDRVELYDTCCRMLIERRDAEREMPLNDYPAQVLSYRQKSALLEDFAYYLMKNGWSEVEQQRADERFSRKLKSMIGSQNLSGADVLKLFVERTSIIREPAKDSIDFTHRTFQEFLAARAAVEEGDIGILIQNAHNDQWREVIILAAGLATKKERENLLKGLIKRGDQEVRHQYQIHLLAVACLETAIELEEPLLLDLQKRLNSLVPPRDTTSVNSLAAAGELAIPYLARRKNFTPEMAAACIHALATIGGDAALDALEEYANDSVEVLNQIFKLWDYFDREIYAERILSKFRQGVRITTLTSLDGFQYFKKVTSLELSNFSQVNDLTPLTSLTQLKSLNLKSCRSVSDLRPIVNLTQLASLDLSSCNNVRNLKPLENLTQLRSLVLSSCEQLSDLSSLATLTQLRSLDLSNCRRINNLTPLASLTQLTTLKLFGCEGVKDLSPLTNLANLTSLNLSRCRRVRDLTPLKSLNNLKELWLYYISPKVLIPEGLEERIVIHKILH